MNKIVVNLGNFKLDEITLGRGTLSIGRASDNDISIADSATSAHHAKIVTIFTSSFIQDLNSTNGTIVNGRKVLRHTLAHGDIISIGNLQLLFKSDTSSSPARPSKSIQIGREKINSVMKTAGKRVGNDAPPETQIIKKNTKLSGFSISIPSAEDLAGKVDRHVATPQHKPSTIATAAATIPVLDETLPLGELRRNPDRMVVLNQNAAPSNQAVSVEDAKSEPLASKLLDQAELEPEAKLHSINDDEDITDTLQNDSQIRKLLMENVTLEKHSREYAIYAVAITVVLIIIAFTYILL